MCSRLEGAFASPFLVDGRELNVAASIGCAIHSGETLDSESLLRAADRAMYDDKRRRRSSRAPEAAPAAAGL